MRLVSPADLHLGEGTYQSSTDAVALRRAIVLLLQVCIQSHYWEAISSYGNPFRKATMNCLWMACAGNNGISWELVCVQEESTDDLYLAMEPRIGCHNDRIKDQFAFNGIVAKGETMDLTYGSGEEEAGQ